MALSATRSVRTMPTESKLSSRIAMSSSMSVTPAEPGFVVAPRHRGPSSSSSTADPGNCTAVTGGPTAVPCEPTAARSARVITARWKAVQAERAALGAIHPPDFQLHALDKRRADAACAARNLEGRQARDPAHLAAAGHFRPPGSFERHALFESRGRSAIRPSSGGRAARRDRDR